MTAPAPPPVLPAQRLFAALTSIKDTVDIHVATVSGSDAFGLARNQAKQMSEAVHAALVQAEIAAVALQLSVPGAPVCGCDQAAVLNRRIDRLYTLVLEAIDVVADHLAGHSAKDRLEDVIRDLHLEGGRPRE